MSYRNVLVALDVATETDAIMARAQAVLGDAATLSVVHVLEPAYFYYGMEPGIGSLPSTFEDDLLEAARNMLGQAGEKYGVAPEHQYLERGHAATQVLRLAEDKEVDLIVVGSHGRHGWKLLLGSSANAVLHGASCDVLAVRMRPA